MQQLSFSAIAATTLSLSLMTAMPALAEEEKTVQCNLQTNLGTITLALNPEKAPETVANFLRYAEEDFYDGTIFHRVIGNFMIQGGGFTQSYGRKQTYAPIRNESDNGLSNRRGTIAMARTNDPHSATAQFFINVKNNRFLDRRGKQWGYAVFGKVVEGMDVVNAIRKVETGAGGPFPKDVPQTQVTIEDVTCES